LCSRLGAAQRRKTYIPQQPIGMALKSWVRSIARVLLACAGLNTSTAAREALAQSAPPGPVNPETVALLAIKTWAVRGEPGQVVYTSPAKTGKPSMTLILPLVQPLGGKSFDDHFKTATDAYVGRFAANRAVHKRPGVTASLSPSGRILTDTIVFKSPTGKGGDIVISTGWQATGGAQVTIELIPELMAPDDPSVKQSSDYVGVLSRRRFELTAEKLELQTRNNR
jgi:hypothetical protein